MIYISHRGCTRGPASTQENHPDFIQSALDAGFDVEIDVGTPTDMEVYNNALD